MTLSLYRIPFLAPYFVEMQRKSFLNLLNNGLIYELSKRNPISSLNKQSQVIFYPEYYQLSVPEYTPKQAILKSKTYASKLYIPLQLTNYKTNQVKLQWVLLGNLPLMTKRGHFIINGAPRVIVNQITRSPGIYYQQSIDQKKIKTYYADLISYRGAWLRLEIDKKKRVWARIKKAPKIPILTLLQSVGITEYIINQSLPIKHAQFLENSMHETNKLENYYHPSGTEQALLAFYLFTNPSKNLSDITVYRAKKFLFRKFFNHRTYDLSKLGRAQLNKKFQSSVSNETYVLTAQDLLLATDYLLKLEHGNGVLDDIDHLKNRRVRASGELIQNQLGTGFVRLEKIIREKMKNSKFSIFSSISTKPVNGALREFFGSSPLSQFMDQTNPLAELTHKRRISSLGPGGISRETAGMPVRGIHPSHYGRICPIETPEGPNAGLVNSLTVFSKINSEGFLETPFYTVYQGQTQLYSGLKFFSAAQEEHITIAPSDLKTNYFNFLPFTIIPVRSSGEFKKLFNKKVEYMSVSPLQMISIATSLIPFLEHDDANRALMGSNMQRQAVPLISPEKPIVGTGLEARVVSDSGHTIQAKTSGFVSYVSNNIITINTFSSNKFYLTPLVSKQKSTLKNKRIQYLTKKKQTKPINTTNLKSNSLTNLNFPIIFPVKFELSEKFKNKKNYKRNFTKNIYKKHLSYDFLLLSNLILQKYNKIQVNSKNYVLEPNKIVNSKLIRPKFHLNWFQFITQKSKLGSFSTWLGFTSVNDIQPNFQSNLISIYSYQKKFFKQKNFSLSRNYKLRLNENSNLADNSNLFQSSNFLENKKILKEKIKNLINREQYSSKLHFFTLSKATIQNYASLISINNKINFKSNSFVKTTLDFLKNRIKINFYFNKDVLPNLIKLIIIHNSLHKKNNKHNFFYVSSGWNNFNIKKYNKIQVNKKSFVFFSKSPYVLQNNFHCLPMNHTLSLKNNSIIETNLQFGKQSKPNKIIDKMDVKPPFFQLQRKIVFKNNFSLEKNKNSIFYFQFPFFRLKTLSFAYINTSFMKVKNKNNSIKKNFSTKLTFASKTSRKLASLEVPPNETNLLEDSRFINKMPPTGFVSLLAKRKTQYSIQSYQRSNQNTCVYQRPTVHEGEWVQKGDLLADGAASVGGELALGKTILVAYMPWEGYNFEDAILINQRLVFDDIYTSVHIERYEIEIADTLYGVEQITAKVPYISDSQLGHLNHNGIVKLGSWVNSGDILVGKVTPIKQKQLSGHEKLLAAILEETKTPTTRDTSLRVPKNVHGRVVHIEILETENIPLGMTFKGPGRVHIYIAEKRKIQVGDKMSGRHGNKGIVSKILPRQDMPYLPDGTPIDMVLNPLGVPSRMNVGQIFECLLGLAVNELNEQIKICCFDEMNGPEASRSFTYSKLFQARLKTKKEWIFNPNTPGKIKLFDGRTGDCFHQTITVGKPYILKLVHLVDEKIHARSTGPYSLVTQQPLRGRSKHGGQRVGEMEVWALEGFGAAYTLQEILTNKSDDIKGRHQVMQAILENISVTLGTPESFKVLLAELQSLCLNIGIYSITNSGIRKKNDILRLGKL